MTTTTTTTTTKIAFQICHKMRPTQNKNGNSTAIFVLPLFSVQFSFFVNVCRAFSLFSSLLFSFLFFFIIVVVNMKTNETVYHVSCVIFRQKNTCPRYIRCVLTEPIPQYIMKWNDHKTTCRIEANKRLTTASVVLVHPNDWMLKFQFISTQ